jgi:hypothetical protein
VGQAPLPPHERAWRHPSELAAAEREAFRTEAVPASTRVFAVVTGTLGLLAIGVLILSASPRRQESPVAISATTTPVSVAEAGSAGSNAGGIAAIGRFASDDDDDAEATPEAVPPALATPIGDGRSALMTRLSTGGVEGDAFDVRLTSGPVVTAAVVDTTADGLVVVTIVDPDQSGHAVAGDLPHDDEMVTILTDPPITILFGDIATVGVDEGTPVVDADGDLIGLCTRAGDGATDVVDVTGQIPVASGTAPPSTAPAATTITTTIAVPSSVSASNGASTTGAP